MFSVSGAKDLPAGEFTVYKKGRRTTRRPDSAKNLIVFNHLRA
jgi:hypothetical protein